MAKNADLLDGAADPPIRLRREWASPLLVLTVAAAMRAWVLLRVDSGVIFTKYPVFARQVAAGADIGNRWLDLSPLYLRYWIAVGPALSWNLLWMKEIQLAAGAVTAVLVWFVARAWLRPPYALAAALLYAGYGYLAVLELTFEPEVFVILFNLAAVALLQRASWRRWRLAAAGAGVCIGLAAVTKPNALLWLPCAWLWFALRERWAGRRRLAAAALVGATAVVVVAPITARNLARFGEPVLITADFGKVFYHGNYHTATALYAASLPNQDADPTGGLRPDYAHEAFRANAALLAGRPLSAAQSSAFWFRRTLRDVAEHPGEYVRRQLGKLFVFFHNHEIALTHTEFLGYRVLRSYPHLPFGVLSVLALAGMGLWAAGPDRERGFWALAGIGVTLVSCLAFYVIARYRSPAVPWLCMTAGFALQRVAALWRAGRRAAVAGVALGMALLAAPLFLGWSAELAEMDRDMANFYYRTTTLQPLR